MLNEIFNNPLLLTDAVPSLSLLAESISLITIAENGNKSLCVSNSAGSVNLILLACLTLSPITISTTFSPWVVVEVFKVNSLVFSSALCAFKKLLINSSFNVKVKS